MGEGRVSLASWGEAGQSGHWTLEERKVMCGVPLESKSCRLRDSWARASLARSHQRCQVCLVRGLRGSRKSGLESPAAPGRSSQGTPGKPKVWFGVPSGTRPLFSGDSGMAATPVRSPPGLPPRKNSAWSFWAPSRVFSFFSFVLVSCLTPGSVFSTGGIVRRSRRRKR